MQKTYFEKYNSEAQELFKEIKDVLHNSENPEVKSKASQIPSSLYSDNKKINVVLQVNTVQANHPSSLS